MDNAALSAPYELEQQFDTHSQQEGAAWMGMWIFLLTEVALFSGLFAAYTTYGILYFPGYKIASNHLKVVLGCINTAVLLTSSLTMVLAIYSLKKGQPRKVIAFLLSTALLGACFLGIKALEYYEDWQEGIWPGASFSLKGAQYHHAEMCIYLYYVMTGIHALHLFIGIGLVLWMTVRVWRGHLSASYRTPLEVTGLYWHFVDIIWVFLFPILYLLGRSQ